MRNLKRILISLLVMVGFVNNSYSQTPTWSIRPEYAQISHYADGLYKVKSGAYQGVMDAEGKVIVPVLADSVTNLSAGYGLVLNVVKDKYQLVGIISADKSYKEIYEEYYVDKYPFFSEGMLPVYNRKGLYGFINERGELKIDFKYSAAKPFSNGYALVSKMEGGAGKLVAGLLSREKATKQPPVSYIDYKDKFLELDSSLGEIYSGTTFHNGEAVVVSSEMKYVVINNYGKKLRELTEIPTRFNRKGAAIFDEEEESETYIPRYDEYLIYSSVDGYGYMDKGEVIIPAQFKHAGKFVDDYAIVSTNGRLFGLVKLTKEKFSCSIKEEKIKDGGKNQVAVKYVFSVPEEWRGKNLTLEYTINGRTQSNIQPADYEETREFAIVHEDSPRVLKLLGDGLVLWTKSIENNKSVSKEKKVSVDKDLLDNVYVRLSNKTTKAQLELFNRAPVTVVITNKNDQELELDLLIYSKEKGKTDYTMSPVSKKGVVIKPGGFYKIYGEISADGMSKPEKRTITIKLTLEDGSEKYQYREITIEPIFIED